MTLWTCCPSFDVLVRTEIGFNAFFDDIAGRMQIRVMMGFQICDYPENHHLTLLASRHGPLMCLEESDDRRSLPVPNWTFLETKSGRVIQ